MTMIAKNCAVFLRNDVASALGERLKPTHAHELVAAFFGYKSYAALLAEAAYPLTNLAEARYLAPDVALMNQRRQDLQDLPQTLPSSVELARLLGEYLIDAEVFFGELWLAESLEAYVTEQLLTDNDYRLMDLLSGVMAETNAYFDQANYDEATVSQNADDVVVEVTGTYEGESDDERPFCGDTLDIQVTVTLTRAAGHVGFSKFDLDASGTVNDDWVGDDDDGDDDYAAASP